PMISRRRLTPARPSQPCSQKKSQRLGSPSISGRTQLFARSWPSFSGSGAVTIRSSHSHVRSRTGSLSLIPYPLRISSIDDSGIGGWFPSWRFRGRKKELAAMYAKTVASAVRVVEPTKRRRRDFVTRGLLRWTKCSRLGGATDGSHHCGSAAISRRTPGFLTSSVDPCPFRAHPTLQRYRADS